MKDKDKDKYIQRKIYTDIFESRSKEKKMI